MWSLLAGPNTSGMSPCFFSCHLCVGVYVHVGTAWIKSYFYTHNQLVRKSVFCAFEQAQLQDALERANQFDSLYTNLHDQLRKAEEAESKQEPIHSEVEAVKQQMEDHKVS